MPGTLPSSHVSQGIAHEKPAEARLLAHCCGWAAGIFCSAFGGILGIALYWWTASIVETHVIPNIVVPGQPRLSYGQQFGLCSTPIAAGLGATWGLVLCLACMSRRLLSSAISFVIGAAATEVVFLLWKSDIERYGHDPSALILYVPLLLGSVSLLVWSVCWLCLSVRRRERKTNE